MGEFLGVGAKRGDDPRLRATTSLNSAALAENVIETCPKFTLTHIGETIESASKTILDCNKQKLAVLSTVQREHYGSPQQ